MDGQTENARLIMRVMKDAQKALRARFLQQLVPHGLTVTQFRALQHLHWHEAQGGLSMSELGGHLGLANSTMSSLVGRLERDGWLLRERSPRDGRRVQLKLTRRAQELFSQKPRQTEEFWQQTLGRLSPEQQARLVESLRELKAVMEEPVWPSYEQLHPHLEGPAADPWREQWEDFRRVKIQASGVRFLLARAAAEEGHSELAAYLNQAAMEELDQALEAERLLGRAPDWPQHLAELEEEEQTAHELVEELARSLEQEGCGEVQEFLRRAAAAEERHKKWFTKLRQQFAKEG
jgi:DNA-binding MarR family transcriptional regulator